MDFQPVSPRFWVARQTVIAGFTGAALLVIGVTAALRGAGVGVVVLAAVVVAVALAGWFVERGRYRAWGYAERADDFIVRRGLLFHRVSVVPYGRMQFIDVVAGPVSRIFGLATVHMHTAAAASDARIPGLRRVDAEALRDRLTTLGEARATGL